MISIGVMVAIIIAASTWAKVYMARHGVSSGWHEGKKSKSGTQQFIANPGTDKALQTYERLAREKLEVIKTALAMGYSDADIAKLDARLEKLIGQDKLEAVLRGQGAAVVSNADLLDTELDREIKRLQQMREAK